MPKRLKSIALGVYSTMVLWFEELFDLMLQLAIKTLGQESATIED